MAKDSLRASLLAHKAKAQELVKAGEDEVLIIEPSLAEQADIMRESRVDGEHDPLLYRIKCLIACCHDPETKQPIFESGDIETIKGMPASAFMQDIGAKCLQFVNGDAKPKN